MATVPHITEAESEVLNVLWRLGPLPPTPLVEAVKLRRPWGEATIKTLLGRLIRKAAVRSVRAEGRLVYEALVTRDTYLEAELQALVDRVWEGRWETLSQVLAERSQPAGGRSLIDPAGRLAYRRAFRFSKGRARLAATRCDCEETIHGK